VRRLLIALVLVAAATASVGGTFSTWSSTVSNDNSIGANSTFDPINTAAPVVTGAVGSGLTLQLQTQGGWRSNLSVTRSYQWQVCTGLGTGCTNIPLATSSSYVIAVVGTFFRVVETATNSYGSTSQASNVLS
jgi:hypothetical protein